MRFDDTTGWRLVRPVEIKEPQQEGDEREYSLFLHPEVLGFELSDVVLRTGVKWVSTYRKGASATETPEEVGHEATRFISATTRFEDDVTVFRMGSPPLARWRDQLVEVQVYPFPRGRAWTSGDPEDAVFGDALPDDSILAKDPGRLMYYAESEASSVLYPASPASMGLRLFVEHDAFQAMADDLARSGRRIVQASMSVSVELFAHEVDRFFREHMRRRDLGLLARSDGRDDASTRARLGHLTFALTADFPTPQDSDAAPEDEDESEAVQTVEDPATTAAQAIARSQESLARTVRRSAWLLAAALIGAALLVR